VENAERRGDPAGHAGLAQGVVGHGPAVQELDHRRAAVREVMAHRGTDAEPGRHAGAVELARAVDGQEIRGRPRDPHDERLPVHIHPVVRVGETVRQWANGDGPAAPRVDPVDDLLDGDGAIDGHGVEAAASPARF
jgi:hypothetical protein